MPSVTEARSRSNKDCAASPPPSHRAKYGQTGLPSQSQLSRYQGAAGAAAAAAQAANWTQAARRARVICQRNTAVMLAVNQRPISLLDAARPVRSPHATADRSDGYSLQRQNAQSASMP